MTSQDKGMAEWQALGQDWQQTAGSVIDVEALQRSIDQRSRNLRLSTLVDLTVAGVALAVCLWSMLTKAHTTLSIAGHSVLIALVLGWMGWSLWQRRRQWRAIDQAPDSLLDFELARTRTSRRLARVSIWLTTAISLALFLVVTAAADSWWPEQAQGRDGLFLSLWAMLALNAVSALIVAIYSYRLRGRSDHLHALKASLQDPA